jgi:hypothetical protein
VTLLFGGPNLQVRPQRADLKVRPSECPADCRLQTADRGPRTADRSPRVMILR